MHKFKDVSGQVFAGQTYPAVVRQMRASAWVVVPKRQYMAEVAHRLRVLGTTGVSVESSEEFVKSLVKTGWLRPLRKRKQPKA